MFNNKRDNKKINELCKGYFRTIEITYNKKMHIIHIYITKKILEDIENDIKGIDLEK